MAINDIKKFGEVFANISMPANIMRAFESSVVEKIGVNNQTASLSMVLCAKTLIEEDKINKLKSILAKEFSDLAQININIRFETEANPDKLILDYWPQVVVYISEISTACAFLLKGALVEADNRIIKIGLRKKGAFVMKSKEVDRQIAGLMRERFAINYVVEFYDMVKEDEDDNAAYIAKEEAAKSEHMEGLALEPRSLAPKAPKKFDGAKQPFKQGGAKRRKSGVRVIETPHLVDTYLNEELHSDETIVIGGLVFELETKETKKGNLIVTFDITDGYNSITGKFFTDKETFEKEISTILKKGADVCVKGMVQYDDFVKETIMMVNEISAMEVEKKEDRKDNAEVKRVELHLHTQMSDMDAINTATDYIKRAASWGHKAIAITDHGVVQAYPEAMEAAKKHGIKVIYGCEAYLVDDLGAVCKFTRGQTIDDEFVVFDIETTGLNKDVNNIIEIGAVKVKNHEIIDRFSALINPEILLPDKIISLTGITDELLKDKPTIDEVLGDFLDFIEGTVLVAHNAAFDVGFISVWAKRLYERSVDNTVLDTVELARTMYPDLNNHKLNTVAAHLEVSLENHHRAVDDAAATAEIMLKSFVKLKADGVVTLDGINILASEFIDKSKLKSRHAVILVKNYEGLRNLYELVSKAHIEYYFRRPRIPKSEYMKLSAGLIIGTACESGELYQAMIDNSPKEHLEQLVNFYDYLEIQPIENNIFLVRNGRIENREALMDINKRIVELGEAYNKPVVATCDVHFLNPEDEVYRRVIMAGSGFDDADQQAPLYLRTTEEMLREFAYLGNEWAQRVVVENTNLISDMCEEIKPIPDETFPPVIEGAEEELTRLTMDKAADWFGESLPKVVSDRIERELGSIIKNGFAVMYIIAQKLVWKSVEDGYLVGSRGSVGSSFVATMSGITEVNPLPPHYRCPACKYSDFDSDEVMAYVKAKPGGSGCDMPDRICPNCGALLLKDGHDIPFETFLGFDGDKEPDIDLNFSGEYQSKAHDYAEELFGKGYIFKAGTISTLADKTAYGYVKKYMEDRQIIARGAEINRIKQGLTGIKRTTGQHPGGLMVVPAGHSIYEFCPIQRPANDVKSTVTTTHFDYHSISGRLLKLDLLGHDVPTIIRYLHDNTGVDPTTVDIGDKKVIGLFTSCEGLGVRSEDIECKTGSLGLPEFGTSFVRGMLMDTKPSSFSELVRISGLSHGTDVWLNNAQELIQDGICTLEEVIPTRDDIMVYLIAKGLERLTSFKIMEDVRKGKGLKPEYEELMQQTGIPDWYIESCKRIKYMFPKGHAVAYVMMTVRIGYFKLYHPYSFYGASFSVKYDDFDYEIMCKGREVVKDEMRRIKALGFDASTKEKTTYSMLELVNEMYCRGLKFVPLDMYKASATKFIVTENGLMPPLCSIQGLGETVAQNIVETREDGEFITIDDFRQRTKTTKTVIELLKKNGVLAGLPETNQLSLF